MNPKGVPCKSDAEINSYINKISLNIFTSSAYFDFDDYDNPIKDYCQFHKLKQPISYFNSFFSNK